MADILSKMQPHALASVLRRSTRTNHERIVALGAWFVRNVPIRPSNHKIGIDDGMIDHHSEMARRPLADILDQLVACRGSVLCGGMAALMQKVAEDAGIASFTLNLGSSTSRHSHVLVLAQLECGDSYAIYDPFFGIFIADIHGQPAPLSSIVNAVAMRRESLRQFKFVRMGPRRKPAVATEQFLKEIPEFTDLRTRMGDRVQTASSDPARFLMWPVDLRSYAIRFARDLLSWISSQRMDDSSVLDLIRYPIGTSGSSIAVSVQYELRRRFAGSGTTCFETTTR